MRELKVRFGRKLIGSVATDAEIIDFEAVTEAPGVWKVTTCDQIDGLVAAVEGSPKFRTGSDALGRSQLLYVG